MSHTLTIVTTEEDNQQKDLRHGTESNPIHPILRHNYRRPLTEGTVDTKTSTQISISDPLFRRSDH